MSWDEIGAAMQRRQEAHDKRREWLRGLKPGDEVLLTCDGDGRDEEVTRVKVTKVRVTGFGVSDRQVFVEGHPRRPLTDGEWGRSGCRWLWLRIDPLEGR